MKIANSTQYRDLMRDWALRVDRVIGGAQGDLTPAPLRGLTAAATLMNAWGLGLHASRALASEETHSTVSDPMQ
jgi:hypothetical protein